MRTAAACWRYEKPLQIADAHNAGALRRVPQQTEGTHESGSDSNKWARFACLSNLRAIKFWISV